MKDIFKTFVGALIVAAITLLVASCVDRMTTNKPVSTCCQRACLGACGVGYGGGCSDPCPCKEVGSVVDVYGQTRTPEMRVFALEKTVEMLEVELVEVREELAKLKEAKDR